MIIIIIITLLDVMHRDLEAGVNVLDVKLEQFVPGQGRPAPHHGVGQEAAVVQLQGAADAEKTGCGM